MVDGIDHPAGDLVNVSDQVAQEWIGQGLAAPAAPAAIETATLAAPPNAAAPAQRRRPGKPGKL